MIEGTLFGDKKVFITKEALGAGGSWLINAQAFGPEVLKKFFEVISNIESPKVLDIGANVGSFCLLAAHHKNMECWAFEPVPPIAKILYDNVCLNNLQKQVHVIPSIALSDYLGSGNMYSFKCGYSGLSSLNIKPTRDNLAQDYNEYPVTVMTVDYYFSQFYQDSVPINVMKIDVEGQEPNVLRGAEKTILKYKPYIVLEFSSDVKPEGDNVWSWLEERGYECISHEGTDLFCKEIKDG